MTKGPPPPAVELSALGLQLLLHSIPRQQGVNNFTSNYQSFPLDFMLQCLPPGPTRRKNSSQLSPGTKAQKWAWRSCLATPGA